MDKKAKYTVIINNNETGVEEKKFEVNSLICGGSNGGMSFQFCVSNATTLDIAGACLDALEVVKLVTSKRPNVMLAMEIIKANRLRVER